MDIMEKPRKEARINFLFADPALWGLAKKAAKKERRSLTGWINELLIRELVDGRKNNAK